MDRLGKVSYTFNLSLREEEEGRILVYNKFQTSQGYTARLSQNKVEGDIRRGEKYFGVP